MLQFKNAPLNRTTQTLYPNVRILNIDVEEHPYAVDDFNIDSVPTMVIMINQKEVMKITGRQEQDYIIAILHYLQQMYEEQLVKTSKTVTQGIS